MQERALRLGRVPDVYRSAVWEKVRSPAIREWTFAVHGRTQRKEDPGPPNWSLLGHGLLIMGPTGTGKSSAAALVAREAVKAGRSVRWSYVPDLVDLMSASPKDRAHEVRMQEAVDLAIWDDFGVRDLADWEIGYLDQIVETRYRARRPMVVTTNWTTSDLTGDVRLSRLVDRWRERTASGEAHLVGESMRLEHLR